MDNILKFYNILVFQLPQQGDFSNSGAWDSFIGVLEFDLLKRDSLSCCFVDCLVHSSVGALAEFTIEQLKADVTFFLDDHFCVSFGLLLLAVVSVLTSIGLIWDGASPLTCL